MIEIELHTQARVTGNSVACLDPSEFRSHTNLQNCNLHAEDEGKKKNNPMRFRDNGLDPNQHLICAKYASSLKGYLIPDIVKKWKKLHTRANTPRAFR
jgi:acyl-ACP thioesterase